MVYGGATWTTLTFGLVLIHSTLSYRQDSHTTLAMQLALVHETKVYGQVPWTTLTL